MYNYFKYTIFYKYVYSRFIKVVITAEFINSINNDPTNGNMKNALGAGLYLEVTDSIFAIPFGVDPRPNPQCPAASTAAV